MYSTVNMLLKFTTLHWNHNLYRGREVNLRPILHSSFSRPKQSDAANSFSPILGPLKCLLPLVLPLLVASWRTTLLDFPYLALPAFQWRPTSHSISEKGKSQATRKRSGTGSVLFYYQTSIMGERLM